MSKKLPARPNLDHLRKQAKKRLEGEWDFVGDEWRVCMAKPGDPRPADFSGAGKGQTLSRWKRR